MKRNTQSSILRVGVYYDGSYIHAVSNFYYYENRRHTRIRIAGLQDFCRFYLAQEYEKPINQIAITEAHWYMIRSGKMREDKARGCVSSIAPEQLQKERAFENHLNRLGVQTHYIGPYRFDPHSCSTYLALDCYDHAHLHRFDVCFLLVYRIDTLPLINRLVGLGIPVYIMVWNIASDSFVLTNNLSMLQQVDACFLPMNDLIDGDGASPQMEHVVAGLFQPDRGGEQHSDSSTRMAVACGM